MDTCNWQIYNLENHLSRLTWKTMELSLLREFSWSKKILYTIDHTRKHNTLIFPYNICFHQDCSYICFYLDKKKHKTSINTLKCKCDHIYATGLQLALYKHFSLSTKLNKCIVVWSRTVLLLPMLLNLAPTWHQNISLSLSSEHCLQHI